MDDLEHWLRNAMRAAEQQPTAGLPAGIWRRRRKHLARVWAGAGAAAAVLAAAVVPVAVHASLGPAAGGRNGSPAAGGHAGTAWPEPGASSGTASRQQGAAPGTKLLTCGMYSHVAIAGGMLSAHWQRSSVKAGPLWLVYAGHGAGWRTSKRLPGGTLGNVPGIIVGVPYGRRVELTTPPADRSRLRFLTRTDAQGRYTLSDGVPGLTFAACPAPKAEVSLPEKYAQGLTLFYLPLGYVTDFGRCLPLEVATPPSWRAVWTGKLAVTGGYC